MTQSKELKTELSNDLNNLLDIVNIDDLHFKNVDFLVLSKAEQRVAIAKDVLKYLKSGEIVPETDTYFEKNKNDCTVCALGSLFYAVASKNKIKKIKFGKSLFHNKIIKPLKKYFSSSQLNLIESCFEDELYFSDLSDKKIKKSENLFGDLSDKNKIKKIMNNIIVHDGKFKPWKKHK